MASSVHHKAAPAMQGEDSSLQFAVFMAVGFGATLGAIILVLGAILIYRCTTALATLLPHLQSLGLRHMCTGI